MQIPLGGVSGSKVQYRYKVLGIAKALYESKRGHLA